MGGEGRVKLGLDASIVIRYVHNHERVELEGQPAARRRHEVSALGPRFTESQWPRSISAYERSGSALSISGCRLGLEPVYMGRATAPTHRQR